MEKTINLEITQVQNGFIVKNKGLIDSSYVFSNLTGLLDWVEGNFNNLSQNFSANSLINVLFVSCPNDKKIASIKYIRELGYKDELRTAKDAVDIAQTGAPQLIAVNLPYLEAIRVRSTFMEFGATVNLVEA